MRIQGATYMEIMAAGGVITSYSIHYTKLYEFLMCDPADIQVSADSRNPLTQAPTVVIYETVAAGVGFSQRLFEVHDELMSSAADLVSKCRCRDGCPSCIGPPGEIGPETKRATRQLSYNFV